ncbi:MAG: 50S ribosome-binding GTPase [Planctomycetes bacterium]|nr:50S ribosome-binding GTPase [Planctomycetota bacterium]
MSGGAKRELTPAGAGAVSVVELAGPDALERARALGAPQDLAPGDIRLARLTLAPGLVDEALVVVPAAERVELHLHGSPALVRAALRGAGPRAPARSIEERALALLERAPCEAAARILLDQAEGALGRELAELARLPAPAARARATQLAERGRCARHALEPTRIVLAGPVNSGKSTLLNALAGEARALVSDQPGTTRDVLTADVLLGAWPARLFDTAGEREPAGAPAAEALPVGAVEAEGLRRGRALRASAELVLWLVPWGREPTAAPPDAVVLVTQADRAPAPPAGAISALCDPAGARRTLGELLRARFGLPSEPWTPGAAVPFEPEASRALAEAGAGRRDLRAALREVAEPRR